MRELVVISGKGGTGKTSLVASFAALAGTAVLADCDVDASDLPIILNPTVQERHDFFQGHHAKIDYHRCDGCGACQNVCRFEAIARGTDDNAPCRVLPMSCEGCGACLQVCPNNAITLEPVLAGQWFVSTTRFGPLVHAQLGPGGENSGKLVSQVRQKAHSIAAATAATLLIVDGPPGIGCPVIATVARASLVLIVTEPTPSGWHDMQRVTALTRHFNIPVMLCVNRWDLNPAQTMDIENSARQNNVTPAGRVRVDSVFNAAQRQRQAVVEMRFTEAGEDVRRIWRTVADKLRVE
ncbi:MAG: ATP-binding protein [Phycisphaerae bacterium]